MEMCGLGENSPPFVSMPLAAMRKAVDYLSGERTNSFCMLIAAASVHVKSAAGLLYLGVDATTHRYHNSYLRVQQYLQAAACLQQTNRLCLGLQMTWRVQAIVAEASDLDCRPWI